MFEMSPSSDSPRPPVSSLRNKWELLTTGHSGHGGQSTSTQRKRIASSPYARSNVDESEDTERTPRPTMERTRSNSMSQILNDWPAEPSASGSNTGSLPSKRRPPPPPPPSASGSRSTSVSRKTSAASTMNTDLIDLFDSTPGPSSSASSLNSNSSSIVESPEEEPHSVKSLLERFGGTSSSSSPKPTASPPPRIRLHTPAIPVSASPPPLPSRSATVSPSSPASRPPLVLDTQLPPHARPPPIPPRPPSRTPSPSPAPSPHPTASAESSPRTPIAALVPPRLPARRATPQSHSYDGIETLVSSPPPIPTSTRPSMMRTVSASNINNNNANSLVNSNVLPPPPTRTVPPGAVPPPRLARRQTSECSSSEDESPKEKEKTNALPDSSLSSRRLPSLPHPYSPLPLPLSSHSSTVKVKGSHVVVATGHHIKCYDLKSRKWNSGEVQIGDGRRVGAFEWAPSHGRVGDTDSIWAGLKDGALLLISISRDADTMAIVDTRSGWHTHAITHLVRVGDKMLSVDEGGKCVLFFSSGASESLKPLMSFRIPMSGGNPIGFVGVFDDMIWIGSGISVRIYSLNDGGARAQTLSCGGAGIGAVGTGLGPVTCGTRVPDRLGRAYLGHEGGYISTWLVPSFPNEQPRCLSLTKIGPSDVLCLLGVHDRLWAGGRKGAIAVYSLPPVGAHPEEIDEEGNAELWKVTNHFVAHHDAPVTALAVDPYSVDSMGRLAVVSFGKDEKVMFWDGCLGVNWIDAQLASNEASFSTFRPLKALVCTWNIDAQRPDALSSGGQENLEFLQKVLTSVERPDIICFGFQEVINLEDRKLTAKTVLLSSRRKKGEDGISEKVTRAYRQWHDKLVQAVRIAMPPNDPYSVVHTENLVGLFSCIFIRNAERANLTDAQITTVKRGMKGLYGNKGAIVARFVIDDSSLSFINCHLAAGQDHRRQRNNDLAAIFEEKSVFPSSGSLDIDDAFTYAGGGDGSMILDHDICFLNGDLNYRIEHRRDHIVHSVADANYECLIHHDQLSKEMKSNPGFRLRSFFEAPITFAPTYKYDPHTSNYDTSEKKRTPAWCDRILYRCRDQTRVTCLNYQRYEANISDHRPVSAAYNITVKRINQSVRSDVKRALEEQWQLEEHKLLIVARDWFKHTAAIL